eukprot:PITA_02549
MNFLRCFVPNLTEHLRELTNMLKKDSQVRWTEEAIKSFNLVKLALSSAPVLVNPNYTHDFILFSFASKHTMEAVLLQKRDDHERPIAFFNRGITDAALKYNIIEKKALVLVKALKDFRVYILHSHNLAYVPNATAKYVLVQTDPWIITKTDYSRNGSRKFPPDKLELRMVEFCHKYQIILGHSISYHPEGNGLAESSNKSLVNIIKKLLETNKKSWHKRLVNALWADWFSQKKSIGTSPFELVYGFDTVFPTSVAASVVKLLKEAGSEEDPMQRTLNQMVHLQQTREEVFKNTSKLQEYIKKIYDTKVKADKFQLDDVVLKWDARNEEKGKHSKFENRWKGPFKIAAYRGQNAFLLKEMNEEDCPGGLIKGRLLKWYHF